jgi:signal transduction histidine kinase
MENCSIQAQRAGDVIRQLMVLLHKGETASEIIDINTSIHEAIDIMKSDGIMNGSKIELYLTAGLPQIKADALQIQKILITLLRNGLESMHEQGETTNPIIVITHQDEVNPSMIKVTVRDSGQGVTDAAMLKKIFQPFHSTKPTGLGMGLPISRSLIAAHGGKMWAEQNVDNGISIHFTLPCMI